MKKPVYKLLDEKGRVLIPLEMRQKAEIEKGDILKVSINTGKIVISKVDILEVGKQDAEAVEAYVHAAVKTMSHEKQVALAARILKLAQQEGGADWGGKDYSDNRSPAGYDTGRRQDSSGRRRRNKRDRKS